MRRALQHTTCTSSALGGGGGRGGAARSGRAGGSVGRERERRRECATHFDPHPPLVNPAQSVKDMPVVQDGPPPGGFPAIRYARRVPSTGPTGALRASERRRALALALARTAAKPLCPPPTLPQGLTLFAVGAAIMAYGFYKVGQGNKARRWVKHEQLERRLALVPFLQAEEDRRWVNAKAEFDATEAEVMKGVSATPTPTPARVGVVVGRRAGCCDRPAPRLRDGGVGCSRCRAIAPPPPGPRLQPGRERVQDALDAARAAGGRVGRGPGVTRCHVCVRCYRPAPLQVPY